MNYKTWTERNDLPLDLRREIARGPLISILDENESLVMIHFLQRGVSTRLMGAAKNARLLQQINSVSSKFEGLPLQGVFKAISIVDGNVTVCFLKKLWYSRQRKPSPKRVVVAFTLAETEQFRKGWNRIPTLFSQGEREMIRNCLLSIFARTIKEDVIQGFLHATDPVTRHPELNQDEIRLFIEELLYYYLSINDLRLRCGHVHKVFPRLPMQAVFRAVGLQREVSESRCRRAWYEGLRKLSDIQIAMT